LRHPPPWQGRRAQLGPLRAVLARSDEQHAFLRLALAAFLSDQKPASAAAAASRASSPNRSSTMACAPPRIGCNCRTSFASVVTALAGMICCGVTTSCAL
jgi:hypothetical protein